MIQQLNSSSIHFPLSQFPHLLSGAITFPVPVFTVWGLIEDVRIVEKFRTGEYEVSNLTVIDEASSALIETAGLKLRLFGLGGAVALHKLCELLSLLGWIALTPQLTTVRDMRDVDMLTIKAKDSLQLQEDRGPCGQQRCRSASLSTQLKGWVGISSSAHSSDLRCD